MRSDLNPAKQAAYEAARQFVQVALRTDGSLFLPDRSVWSIQPLNDLYQRFNLSPDTGSDSFEQKFRQQLAGASTETIQLAAELVFVHFLIARDITGETKRRLVMEIISWATEPIRIPEQLEKVFDVGVVSTGIFFKTGRPNQLWFLIEALRTWKSLPEVERTRLLEDPWEFKTFLEAVPIGSAYLQRQALLHLIFPTVFEDIISRDQKAQIVKTFRPEISTPLPTDIDRALAVVRDELGAKYGTELSFWESPWAEHWHEPPSPSASSADPADSVGLGSLFEQALVELTNRTPGAAQTFEGATTLRHLIEVAIPQRLEVVVAGSREVKGSIGMGMIADVPWVGIFGLEGNASAKSGYYLVYLFATDGSAVYLSLNQGTEDLPGGAPPLKKRAVELRSAAGSHTHLLSEIDLHSKNARPRRYEAGNAYAIKYDKGDIPSNETLEKDLQSMLAIVAEVDKMSLILDPKLEPLHLLFKWNDVREPNTIALHRSIAIEKGSVWWGRFGSTDSPGMSASRLVDIQHQLSAGIPTHVYLYRRGEIWRTNLGEITTDPNQVDVDRLPNYYGKDDCNLFVRITDFENLPADWAPGHLVPASSGDPEKLTGALSNQTTPLFMFEMGVESPMSLIESQAADPGTELSMEWLMGQTLLDEQTLQGIIDSVTDESPQVILAGPPGTGKTWVARAIARYLTNDVPLAYQMVQFHPSYGYEEFVEGLRPVAENGAIEFRRVDGVVLDLVNSLDSPKGQVVLIIDEMNRANLPRVFGELLFLLEYRDTPMNLLYTKDFELPSGFLVIGTMNTADRSIRSIDTALRRRFDLFEFPPSPEVLERFYEGNVNEVSDLIAGFTSLNDQLEAQLGRYYLIGHTFFMRSIFTRDTLRQVWDRQVFPLIEEYFFDQPDIANQFILEEIWPSLAN